MALLAFSDLACPLDGGPLTESGGAWRCANGHSFDVAREGYINLLPVQKKRSRDPGDSKEMVAARRRFLNAGHYAAIAQTVAAMLSEHTETAALSVLDAGCGEGYYLRQLSLLAGKTFWLLGVDISKWAIAAAARQGAGRWVVGSNANLPVLPESLDCILCLFGFPVYAEFARVLKDDALLLMVDAGPDHLRELREIIYPELKPARGESVVPAPFIQIDSTRILETLDLTESQSIQDLLVMTPHLYRASAEGRERALALQMLTVTVDVTLRMFRVDRQRDGND